METRSIDKDIQYRVLNQLEVRHQEEHRLQGVFLGNEILQNIPQKLVEEIKIDFYGKIIKQSPFLTSFSLTFQNQLAQCMQEAVLRPGDIIFQRGDQGNKLYYLNSGHVQFYIPMGKFGRLKKSIVSIKSTKDQQFFGYCNFINFSERRFSAECLTTTHLIYIDLDRFLTELQKSRSDYEKFCCIRD